MGVGNATLNPVSVFTDGDVPVVKEKRSKGYLLIWPAFLYLLAFLIVYPFGYNVYQSFFQYSMLTDTSFFVGVKNYIGLFTSPEYLNSIWVGLIVAFFSLAIETLLGERIADSDDPFADFEFIRVRHFKVG